jgi:aryl-alcohol dehydrogenase-like predicted oxidoreductase
METRTIGSLTVSVVGLGCNNFGMRIGRKETDAVVGAALDTGITLFDTADIYGGTKSEEYLGAALGSRRDEIILATKYGVPYEGHEGGASPAYIRTALDDSLRRLGTDRIDLYQQHLPDKKTPIADTLGTLAELVAEGKVREFGCSNFDGAMLEEAAAAVVEGKPGFASVQNQYSLLYREPEDEVLPFCDRTGTAFLPFFPLASGLLSGKYRAGQEIPEGTRMAAWGERAKNELTPERLATVASLDALAQREGHTVLELAFAWLLSHRPVASVIAGATKPEQITANVAAGQWQPSADVLAEADRIAAR